MSEEEYYASEPDDNDEILYEFLIDEPDDLTLLMMPKLEINLDEMIESYYKRIKKCRNKEQLIHILHQLYNHASGISLLSSDIKYLQDRAKELEFNINMMKEDYS